MRHSGQNSILIFVALFIDISRKFGESIGVLFLGKKGSENGIVWSLLHHIMIIGPKSWKKYPTAITIGRALFVPFVFLFSHLRSSGDSQRK